MMRYTIPIRLHKRAAKTKAEIAYVGYPDPAYGSPIRAADECVFFDVEADTAAGAMRRLQEVVLPGDRRPIQGRTHTGLLKHFIVRYQQ